MKRRKKKVSTHQTKQEYGARLKIYKQKIFHYLKLIGCEEVIALIDKNTLQDMYRERNDNLPKILHSEGEINSHYSIRKIRADLDELISVRSIEIGHAGARASSKEVTAYNGIIYRMVMAHEHSFDVKILRIVKQFKEKFPELNGAFKKANQEIDRRIEQIASKNDYKYYFILFEVDVKSRFKSYAAIRVKFFKSEAEYEDFKSNYNPFE